ncbi:MAG: DUF4315 family protein [Butyrivibrio sp.]|nr:DUF4315 family protein [Butyrivibrio sp.]
MDKATEKIVLEIEKEQEKKKALEEKLKASNEKIKQLEAKKLEAENAQMISSIRDLNIGPEELADLLRNLKAKNGAVTVPVVAKEEVVEEKAV